MKLISLTCSKCGANLEVDSERNFCFCQYCGTKLMIDNEQINIQSRFIDEARLREAEVRMKELEYQHERELKEEAAAAQLQKEKRNWKVYALVYIAMLLLLSSLNTEVGGAFIVLGFIALMMMKPKEEVTKQAFIQVESTKSRWVALALCFFFGIFGGHYLYVRRYGMFVLYLLTGGLCCFGAFIDFFRIAFGSFTDADGRRLN